MILTIGGVIVSYVKSGGPLRGFWYLKCLFIFIIVNYGLVKLIKNEYLAAVVSVAVFLLLPNVNFTRMMIPFFWLGFFYEKIEMRLNNHYTLAITGLAMILCYAFLDLSKSYLSNPHGFVDYSQFLLIGLSASMFWITLFRLSFNSSNTKAIKTLQNIGGLSLGIYCSHELLYFERGWRSFYNALGQDNIIAYILCATLILVIAYILIKFTDKSLITRCLLLGKIIRK